MDKLFQFVREISLNISEEEFLIELIPVDKEIINYDFNEAVKSCMLRGYSFKEAIDIILSFNYDYKYLELCLSIRQVGLSAGKTGDEFSKLVESLKALPKRIKKTYKSWENPYKFHR